MEQVSRIITILKNDLHDCIKYLFLLLEIFSEFSIFSPWHDEAYAHNFQPSIFQKRPTFRKRPTFMFSLSLFFNLDSLMMVFSAIQFS